MNSLSEIGTLSAFVRTSQMRVIPRALKSKVFALCPNYRTTPHLNFNIVFSRPRYNAVGIS